MDGQIVFEQVLKSLPMSVSHLQAGHRLLEDMRNHALTYQEMIECFQRAERGILQ